MMQVLRPDLDEPNTDRRCNGFYSLDFKLRVLDWYHENGEKKGETCRKFNMNRKALQNWLLLEKQLRTRTPFVRIEKIPTRYRQKLEQSLLDWFKEQKAIGESTSTPALRAKALELAADLGIQSFKASRTWVTQWKKRNKVDTSMIDEHDDPSVHVVTMSPPPDALGDEEDTEECTDGHNWTLDGLQQDEGEHNTPLNDTKHDECTKESSWKLQLHVKTSEIHGALGQSVAHDQAFNFSQQSPEVSTVQAQTRAGNNCTLLERLSEHEQWISIVQQTVEGLEADITSKIAQMKLVLQQLKTSICETRALAQLGETPTVGSKRLSIESNVRPQPRKLRKI